MKKISTKKVLVCLSIIFFLLGGLFIYAVDVIKIDPFRFVSTMRIQQIHLYYRLTKSDNGLEKDDIVKAGLKNEGGNEMGVLYIRPVDVSDNFVDDTNNSIYHPDEASIIGGQQNTNKGYESTMLLGGTRNTADGQGVVLMGGEHNTALVDNAVILGSANATVSAPNGVVLSSNGGTVNGRDSTLLGGGGTIYAENSFGVKMGGTLNQKGVFMAGDVTVNKPNIVALNVGEGLIVKGSKPNGNSRIKLTVNGAVAVGYMGSCTENMVGSIYYYPAEAPSEEGDITRPAYCLCSCVKSGAGAHNTTLVKPMALSNQPYCDGICNGEGWSQPKCGTRGLENGSLVYEYGEKDWRVASNFCRDNTLPISYTLSEKDGSDRKVIDSCTSGVCDPKFLGPGQKLTWVCKGVGMLDEVTCGATRKIAPPENAVCGKNADKYVFYSNDFLGSSAADFCYWGDPSNPDNRSENAVPVAIKILTAEQIKNGITGEYMNYGINRYNEVLSNLNVKDTIPIGGRVYWKCATTNADKENIADSEVVTEQECYADRLPCNSCYSSGFPYCFDVDFSDSCKEGVGGGGCIPGSDNNGKYHALYNEWNSQTHDDTMFAEQSKTEVASKPDWVSVEFKRDSEDHYYARYHLDINETNSIRTGVVRYKTTDASFCDDWEVYLVQCGSGYILEGHQCVKIDCRGTPPKHAVLVDPNRKIEAITDVFLATGDDLNKDCAYKCEDGYTYLGGAEPFCAKCAKDGIVNVDLGWCEFTEKEFCKTPYWWFEDLGESGKCALPGSCIGYQEPKKNAPNNVMNQDYIDIRPIANKYNQSVNAYCVEESSYTKHQCAYTCDKSNGYMCVGGTCVKPECYWNSSTEGTKGNILNQYIEYGALYWSADNNDNFPNRNFIKSIYYDYRAFQKTERYRNLNTSLKNGDTTASYWFDIYNTGMVVKKNPSLYGERWFFVEAKDKDEFNSKVDGLNGCFYWCNGDNLRIRLIDNKYVSYECGERKSSGGGSYGGTTYTPSDLVYLCKGTKPSGEQYLSSSEYGHSGDVAYSKSWKFGESNEACHYRCKDGYDKKTIDGIDYCVQKCNPDENNIDSYARGDYRCMKCPDGYQPTTDDLDINGNPTGCWKKCKNTEKVGSDGMCYSCGIGKKGKLGEGAKLDKHGNATECEDVCAPGETFWTAVDKSDCGGYDTCCLPTYQNGSTRCDDPQKYPECSMSSGKCICRTNLEY